MKRFQPKSNPCDCCRNYQLILNQLQLLKRQIQRKNQRIIQLQLFIAHLSRMALTDSTHSYMDSEQYNPMNLTFKKQNQLDSDKDVQYSQAHACSEPATVYLTQSQPYEQGTTQNLNIINTFPIITKRQNQSTNFYQ